MNLIIPWYITPSAAADPPPPPEWPFGDDFMQQSWLSTSEALYGPVDPDTHTVFYVTDQVVSGVGLYTGRNNEDQPFSLDVIRHHAISATRGEQHGVFWGTMWTAVGSVNIIGLSMSFPAEEGVAGSTPTKGIMPLANHDVMMGTYAPDLVWTALKAPGTGLFCSGEIFPCFHCAHGPLWCPCNDPDVQLAADVAASCLATCSGALAAYLYAQGISDLISGIRTCLPLLANPVAFLACVGVHAIAFAIQYKTAMTVYAACCAGCWWYFELSYNNAMAAACAP